MTWQTHAGVRTEANLVGGSEEVNAVHLTHGDGPVASCAPSHKEVLTFTIEYQRTPSWRSALGVKSLVLAVKPNW